MYVKIKRNKTTICLTDRIDVTAIKVMFNKRYNDGSHVNPTKPPEAAERRQPGTEKTGQNLMGAIQQLIIARTCLGPFN
jgi:hypothetical protein